MKIIIGNNEEAVREALYSFIQRGLYTGSVDKLAASDKIMSELYLLPSCHCTEYILKLLSYVMQIFVMHKSENSVQDSYQPASHTQKIASSQR